MRKYNELDLRKFQKEYEENFIRLKETVGKRGHSKYVKMERLLHKKNLKILKDVGKPKKIITFTLSGKYFDLAERELLNEIDRLARETYTILNILDYGTRIRTWIDKHGYDTEKVLGKKEYRRNKYYRNEK